MSRRPLSTARLVRTDRGRAVLTASGRRFPVTCEISHFTAGSQGWRTGWVAGDLLSLAEGDGPIESQLHLAAGAVLRGSIDSIDGAGANFEGAAG